MINPYEILGVLQNVSDDIINEVYRERHNKYIGDDKATAELNQAYHMILEQRKISADKSKLSEVRYLVENVRFTEANNLLDSCDNKNAEWYFLKGKVCYNKGWLNNAYENFSTAVNMEPCNTEYADAFKRMSESKQGNMTGNPDKNKNINKTKKFFNKDDCCICCCEMEWCECICDILN